MDFKFPGPPTAAAGPERELPALAVTATGAAAAGPEGVSFVAASAAATPYHAEEMPEPLRRQFQYIYQWANDNLHEAKQETFSYWALKAPVIIASAGYGALLYFKLDSYVALAGAIASACALIDGIYRPGSLRNFHHRAHFELRTLADDLMDRWDMAVLRKEDTDALAAQLIEEAKTRKAAISHYLVEVEATLGKEPEHKEKTTHA